LQVGLSTFEEVRKEVLGVFSLDEAKGEIVAETDDAWEYQYVRAKLFKVRCTALAGGRHKTRLQHTLQERPLTRCMCFCRTACRCLPSWTSGCPGM